MQAISEKDKVHTEWYEEAPKQTLETLPKFIDHLLNDYQHDYGTICHAMTAGGIAAMWAMNGHNQGGITGFQAGCIMWEFIRQWNRKGNKTGLRLVDYDNFLYPQYESEYQKTISPSVWKAIKDQAQKNIDKTKSDFDLYLKKLDQYDTDIDNFIKKYPDYPSNPDKYKRIGFGTSDQWEEQKKKQEAGFEFAPDEPYSGITDESPVYKHWETIVAGKIPFGYSIGKD